MNQPMHPSDAYLRLAEGPEDLLGSELSLTRRLLTLVVAIVLFFTLSASKRPQYVLPVMVPLALLLAVGATAAPGVVSRIMRLLGGAAAVAAIGAIVVGRVGFQPAAGELGVVTPPLLEMTGLFLLVWGLVTVGVGHWPAAAYAFETFEPDFDVPSPKFQSYETMVCPAPPADVVALKKMVCPTNGLAGLTMKSAVGAAPPPTRRPTRCSASLGPWWRRGAWSRMPTSPPCGTRATATPRSPRSWPTSP